MTAVPMPTIGNRSPLEGIGRVMSGVPCCDSAASRLEMQPRNIGSEFVGTRLRKLADAVAARPAAQILSGLLGDSERDEAGGDAADSRTATGLAAPGPGKDELAQRLRESFAA